MITRRYWVVMDQHGDVWSVQRTRPFTRREIGDLWETAVDEYGRTPMQLGLVLDNVMTGFDN